MRTDAIAFVPLTAVLFLAAAPLVGGLAGCDVEVAPAEQTAAPAPASGGSGVPAEGRRQSTTALGRSRDTAERTRDMLQERDAEIGRMADDVFE